MVYASHYLPSGGSGIFRASSTDPEPEPCFEDPVDEPTLSPVKPERVAEELRKICNQRDTGQLDRDEYEHRFARMISELRDRKIDGTRAEIMAALQPLRAEGKVDAIAWERLTKSLGLA